MTANVPEVAQYKYEAGAITIIMYEREQSEKRTVRDLESGIRFLQILLEMEKAK